MTDIWSSTLMNSHYNVCPFFAVILQNHVITKLVFDAGIFYISVVVFCSKECSLELVITKVLHPWT